MNNKSAGIQRELVLAVLKHGYLRATSILFGWFSSSHLVRSSHSGIWPAPPAVLGGFAAQANPHYLGFAPLSPLLSGLVQSRLVAAARDRT